jgi:hypothetical protein
VRRFSLLLALCALALVPLTTSCASRGVDRCYIPLTRYEPVKEIYVKTGSMQRVEEVMEQEKWAQCERNQLRYYLARDLKLEQHERELLSGSVVTR